MKIKVTDKKSGLEPGKVYDLCDMAAKNLIDRRLAVVDVPEAPKTEKKTETKVTAPKKVKAHGLQNK
jgi:hypothetical protein